MTHNRSVEGQKQRELRYEIYLARKQEREQMFKNAFYDKNYQNHIIEIVSRGEYHFLGVSQGEVLVNDQGQGSLQRVT